MSLQIIEMKVADLVPYSLRTEDYTFGVFACLMWYIISWQEKKLSHLSIYII